MTVNAGAFVKLQLLMPGETAAPGTPTGKTGSPTAQTAGTGYTVTVNAVDANWNLISINDTVCDHLQRRQRRFAGQRGAGGGTRTFSLTNKTAGSWTVTATDVTQAGITASTSIPSRSIRGRLRSCSCWCRARPPPRAPYRQDGHADGAEHG